MLLDELRRAFIALGYFTRAPIPAWVGWSDRELDRAARYFPLIGAVVGGVAAAALLAGARLWPVSIAVALSMLCTLLFTGGFHEDGLADSADGFGGGATRERVLEIMRDSRIGSFGAIALVLVLLTKFAALWEIARLSLSHAALGLVIAHAASRGTGLLVMALLPYARPDEQQAKAKPVAQGIGPREWITGALFAVAPALLACLGGAIGGRTLLTLIATCGVVLLAATRYFRSRIDGYTGDCLGATQQVAEIAIYLVLLAALR
ncbi:MAG: cobS [Panacagrimonas sp.]|jgi:adenosylcobinamide-GDP ribazoletransferase|nr:adenosylcobinamide-GDP ribazoletransferase [Panacagrimonas sp.]MCC2656448.1 cobS [Panacagrimonas sp.]